MKVLFLTNIPTPYRVDFFNELGKYCDLTVLYERKSASNRDVKWKREKASSYKEVFLRGINIRSDASICLDVTKWLKKDKFDLVIVGGYSTPTGMLAIKILKLKKIPFILNCDGGFISQDNKMKYLIKKFFISSANWWLSSGDLTNKYLEHYGANKENIFIFPFTSIKKEDILNERLKEDEVLYLRKQLGINGKKVAISVGRYLYIKGYDLLINTWKNFDKDWELLIIGSGPEELTLRKIIKENELKNVKLIGFKTKQELSKYYLAADLFILPTRGDVWGLVVNEAMAYGLPVITSNKCIAGEELIGKTNKELIFNIDKNNELLEKIKLIMCSEKRRKIIAEKNLETSKIYTIENMAKEHYEIFKKIKNLSNKNI